MPERARRRSYTGKYKAEILAEYDRLDRDDKPSRGALSEDEQVRLSRVLHSQRFADAAPATVYARGIPNA